VGGLLACSVKDLAAFSTVLLKVDSRSTKPYHVLAQSMQPELARRESSLEGAMQ
jgi:hypothetical protein